MELKRKNSRQIHPSKFVRKIGWKRSDRWRLSEDILAIWYTTRKILEKGKRKKEMGKNIKLGRTTPGKKWENHKILKASLKVS